MRQFAVWKDIAVNEIATAVRRFFGIRVGRSYAVVQCNSAIGQQCIDLSEIVSKVVQADVFEHSDAGDFVEFFGDIPIVLQADLAAILKTGNLHPT